MLKTIYTSIVLVIGLNTAYASDSVQIGATRLIYDGSKSQASISVSNSDTRAYLIQSWVANKSLSDKAVDDLFITTPPLFRLEPKTDNSVRVVYNGQTLPKDRESVFWLNIKAIPSVERSDNNKLTIAIKTQLKLFYRPSGLSGNPADAYKKLKFLAKDGKLSINNPTPYSVSLNDLKVNGSSIEPAPMILPFSTTPINKTVSAGNKVSWQAINDFGGLTAEEKTNIVNQ